MKKINKRSLRIIGGQWRRRQLYFPEVAGLRPTPDRTRESIFNSLAPLIKGCHCLDLFAGSGILGLEALSRGAKSVVLVEKSLLAFTQIKANCDLLATKSVQCRCQDAFDFLNTTSPHEKFDLVFVDPPFYQGLALRTCHLLAEQQWLNPNAWVYVEAEKTLEPQQFPPSWQIKKSKLMGSLRYYLLSTPTQEQESNQHAS